MSYEIVKSIVIKNDKVFSRIESNNVYPKSFISEENPGLTKILNEDGKAELLVKLVEGGLDGYLRFQKNGNKLVKELEGITNKLWEDEKCKKLKSNVYSLEYKLWDFKEENNEKKELKLEYDNLNNQLHNYVSMKVREFFYPKLIIPFSIKRELDNVIEMYEENMANDDQDIFSETEDSYANEMLSQDLYNVLSRKNVEQIMALNNNIYVLLNIDFRNKSYDKIVEQITDKLYDKLIKTIDEKGKLGTVKKGIKLSNCLLKVGIDIRKKLFKEIHDNLGGCLRVMVAGGAALSPEKEKGFWDLGFNVLQGYGLTETSPVIAAELTRQKRLSSIGKKFPSVEVKIDNPDKSGVGELLAKGKSVMLGYYNNEEANKEVFTEDGWFRTGDLARIDKDGYIYISGRKKFVIVLKNGKNVYPEEIESLLEKSDLIKECMVFGMPAKDGDVTLSVKVCYDKDYIKKEFGEIKEEEIKEKIWNWVKEVNKTMPKYKYVKKLLLTDEELVKTTTLKIKRNIEMEKIMKNVTKM